MESDGPDEELSDNEDTVALKQVVVANNQSDSGLQKPSNLSDTTQTTAVKH